MASIYIKNVIPYKASKKTYKTQYLNFIKKVGFPFDRNILDKMLLGFGSISIQNVPDHSVESFEKYITSALYAVKKDKEKETAFFRLSENEKLFSLAAGEVSEIKNNPLIGKYIYVDSFETKILNTKKELKEYIDKNSKKDYFSWHINIKYDGQMEILKDFPVYQDLSTSSSLEDIFFSAEKSLFLAKGESEMPSFSVIRMNVLVESKGEIKEGIVATVGARCEDSESFSPVHHFKKWEDIYSGSFGGVAVDTFEVDKSHIPTHWANDEKGGVIDYFNGVKISKHKDKYSLSFRVDKDFFIVAKSSSIKELKKISLDGISIQRQLQARGYSQKDILPLPTNGEKCVSIKKENESNNVSWMSPRSILSLPNLIIKNKKERTISSILSHVEDNKIDQNTKKTI